MRRPGGKGERPLGIRAAGGAGGEKSLWSETLQVTEITVPVRDKAAAEKLRRKQNAQAWNTRLNKEEKMSQLKVMFPEHSM